MSRAQNPLEGEVLVLDVGAKRIGVARVNTISRLPEPLDPILTESQESFSTIQALIKSHDAVAVVIGLPRGLDGQETDQTRTIRDFARQLRQYTNVDLYFIDEAGTSKEAEQRMQHMRHGSKDSIAAAIIAEDFVAYPAPEELRI